jgi:hypothetical protein
MLAKNVPIFRSTTRFEGRLVHHCEGEYSLRLMIYKVGSATLMICTALRAVM